VYQVLKFIGLSHFFLHTFVNDFHILIDTSPNSLRDLNVGPRTKQQKNKRIGAHSLTHNTSGLGMCIRIPRWD
jgi:hypothetical protein